MASEIRVNQLTNRSGLGTITFANGGVQFSGITTFANGEFYVGTGATIINPSSNEFTFHTGGSNRFTINNSGVNIPTLTATTGTFSGDVSIGGVLTYEDVKNVDSIGIITARGDISIADKIIHTGDTDTTIRFPAADTITAETAGSARLRVHPTGQVTIGSIAATTDKSGILHTKVSNTSSPVVFENDTENADVVIRTTGSNKHSILGFGDGADNFIGNIDYDHQNNAMVFDTNGGERLSISSSGLVTQVETGTGNGQGGIKASTASAGGNAGFGFITNGTQRFSVVTIGSAGSEALRVYDVNNSAERLRITSDGVLGVRTTPEAWHTDRRSIQIGGAALSGQNPADGQELALTNNAYYDTTDNRWEFIANDDASGITMSNGGINFLRSPSSGTADAALSWATSVFINDIGYLKTNSELWVGGSSPTLRWRNATTEYAVARITSTRFDLEVANYTKLRVNTSGKITNFYDNSLNVTDAQYGQLELQKSGASDVNPNWSYLSFHRVGVVAWQQGINSNDFVIAKTGGGAKSTLDTEKLRIASSYARIGINTSTFDTAGSQLKIEGRGTGTTSPPYLQIKGVGNSNLHSYVDLIATSDNNESGGNPSEYRGMGVVMHDEPSNKEWFAGRPYAGSDEYIIGRKASPSYRTESSLKANAFFKITSGGNIGVGVASPGRKVHIKDSGIIKLENTSTGGWLGLEFLASSGTNNYDGYMGLLDSNGLFFIDNNSNGIDFAITQTGLIQISEPGISAGNAASSILQIKSQSQYDGIALGTGASYSTISRGASNAALVFTANANPANLGGGQPVTYEWWSGSGGGGGPTKLMTMTSGGRVNIGEGNSGTALAALHINTPSVVGTDTALFIGNNSDNRFMTINQNPSSEQFSHMSLRYNDNARRAVLQLENPYAASTGFGTQILFQGYGEGTQAYIETANTTVNSAQSTLKLHSSGNSGIDITHDSGVYIRQATGSRGILVQGHSSASHSSAVVTGNSSSSHTNIELAYAGTRGQLNFGGHGDGSVYLQVESGYVVGTSTLQFDYSWQPGGNGGIRATMWASHWTAGYDLYWEGFIFGDSYSNITLRELWARNSVQQGAWSITRPANNKLRISKSAGSYGGGMYYVIMMWHPGRSMTLSKD